LTAQTYPTSSWDLVIIGGGPAGYFAGIICAENSTQPRRILILEKAKQPLGKVLISGGGRCNVTHACYEPAKLTQYYPRGGQALRGAFTRYNPADIVDWFTQRGVPLKTEPDGRIFPTTDSAKTITDCLENAAHHAGIQVFTQSTVHSVQTIQSGGETFFEITCDRHQSLRLVAKSLLIAKKVLFASGSDRHAYAMIAGLGHNIEAPVPSLFTFRIEDPRLEGLAGISIPSTRLSLSSGASQNPIETPPIAPQTGALLITHWGLSGPAVLRLSAWGARWLFTQQYQSDLIVNWVYPISMAQVNTLLTEFRFANDNSKRQVSSHSVFPHIPVRLWKKIIQSAGLSEKINWGDVSKSAIQRLANELASGRFQIRGKGQFKDEFVTCGGVRLSEVNFKTMESKLVPNLYFAGEVLDVDGLTGGFNFQNAWTTGWIAGKTIADRE
jgi:predicted Rossmann fold flavoprotein